MSINRDLMIQTISELKANKRFQATEKKLERCEKINKVLFGSDIVSTGGIVAGAGVMVGNIIELMTNAQPNTEEALIAGTVAFGAGIVANTIVHNAKVTMAEKEKAVRDCMNTNVINHYISKVNKSLKGTGLEYSEEDYADDFLNVEKPFDMKDYMPSETVDCKVDSEADYVNG